MTSETKYQLFLTLYTQSLLRYWRTPAYLIKTAEEKAREEARKRSPERPRGSIVVDEIGSWAAARKCLNIFVLSARMNSECGWPRRINDDWLEIPIDEKVASCLSEDYWLLPVRARDMLDDEHETVMAFKGLKWLSEEAHEDFQKLAREVATARCTSRAFLDLAYYEPGDLAV